MLVVRRRRFGETAFEASWSVLLPSVVIGARREEERLSDEELNVDDNVRFIVFVNLREIRGDDFALREVDGAGCTGFGAVFGSGQNIIETRSASLFQCGVQRRYSSGTRISLVSKSRRRRQYVSKNGPPQ